ncbi:hypothetical protein BUALT_Bualt13G0046300 [Buddleja alternifolia]|uniref:C2H2-type domain-containing protein n=1 Tax=Buddleja alternifolia TaxID=168488 RepID=A0AAV6WRY8_9LAMI|nr:hypothetical protein BUALT_Bualt13G0046300 [Buddleja alternifolia]
MADQQKRDEPAGSPPPPYLSADGRLVVKLKLPKVSEEEDDSGADVSPPPPEIYPAGEIKNHQCTECNKSFSSGKALGGHMSSAHVQANKDHSLKKLKSKMKRYSGSGSGSGSGYVRELICRICGKDFPSRKSLFGHMRCHPERDWRGMDPPSSPGLKINSPEASMGPEIDNVGPEEGFEVNEIDVGPAREDLSKSLSGWAQTAKRGRQVMSSSLSSRSRSDNEAIDVFYKLLQLLKDKKDEGVEGLSSNSMTVQGDNVSEVGVVESKKRKRDSSLRICEPEDNIDSNFLSKDNESNSTINNDLMNVEQLEGIKSGVQHELLMNGDKLKGAKCNTEIQENRATGGGAESRTGSKNGGEKRHMDTQENPFRGGRMETQENPRSEGRVKYRSEKGKAKCLTGNENDLHLEEEGRACTSFEKGKAKCHTSIRKDEELEEGEIEVEKDEELEEGEIEVQKDEQLEGEIEEGEIEQLEGEIEVQKYAQRKPLLLGGMAKCHTGTHNNPCEGGAKCGSSGQTMKNMFEQRAKCRTRTQNTEKMPPRDSKSSEASEDDQGKHICDICNRSFTTHQALGGHRSSHNKFKINIVNTNKDSRDKSSRRSPSQRAPTNDEENSLHLCNICNKNFPSGRALGGHKRCHADQGPGPCSSHGKDEKDTETAQKVLLFDLNKMPDEKDEDVQ